MAASPSAWMRARISGSSTQLSFGRMMRVSIAGQVLREPGPQLIHEGFGVVEQAVDEVEHPPVEAL